MNELKIILIVSFLVLSGIVNSAIADDGGIEKIIAEETNKLSVMDLPSPIDPTASPIQASDLSMQIQKEIDTATKQVPAQTMTDVKNEAQKTIKEEIPKMKEELKSESLTNAIPNGSIVQINTDKGPIKISLYSMDAPKTVANFVDLVQKGFYNGTIFHRVVDGFVIQGGDPLGNGTGNYIDKDTGKVRYVDLEISPNLKWDKIGRVGMARSSNPNSASCQFFIALDAVPFLNPGGVDPHGYAVFGQVTDDTLETLKKIVAANKPVSAGSETPSNPIKMTSLNLVK